MFIVYNHKLVTDDGTLINRKFIALKSDDGTLQFTDFHKYAFSPKQVSRALTDDGNNRFSFIVQLLNYAFFTCDIESLTELTVDMVADFLMDYGMCELPGDDEFTSRSKQTVERCTAVVMDFLHNLIEAHGNELTFTKDDLYTEVLVQDKRGRAIKKKVPKFTVQYKQAPSTRHIFRDMPDSAFRIIYGYIYEHHKELLMLVTLSAFAGLRPSECCNVRRMDSPLGPGLMLNSIDGEVTKVRIDLKHEYVLRSDLTPVGRIKKERTGEVPEIFLNAFIEAYNEYMSHIEGRKYETDYGPLSINKQGKAYTYASYRRQFQAMIQNEIIPIFLESNDPELVIYGRTLMENRISPHIFRHWFTVKLVQSGINEPATLMFYRGDTSPESALTYLQNKGELEKEFRKVNDEVFDYISWAATKNRGGQSD